MGQWKSFPFMREQDKYDIAIVIEKFDQYFRPKSNFTCKRNHFWTMKTKPAATFEQMLALVRIQFQKCEFKGVTPAELTRDKLIMMITDTTLKKNLVKKQTSLDEFITEACSHFGTKNHTEECESLGHAAEASIHELRSERSQTRGAQNRKKSQSRGKCGRLGKSHNKGKSPAYGKTCRKYNGRIILLHVAVVTPI